MVSNTATPTKLPTCLVVFKIADAKPVLFNTAAISTANNCVLNADNVVNDSMQIIGTDTFGTYLTISDAEILSQHSDKIAQHLISQVIN